MNYIYAFNSVIIGAVVYSVYKKIEMLEYRISIMKNKIDYNNNILKTCLIKIESKVDLSNKSITHNHGKVLEILKEICKNNKV